MDDFDSYAIPTSHNGVFGQQAVGAQQAAMNHGITPLFFLDPVINPKKSAEAGRPIADNVEKVRLFIAGDPYMQPVHPVDQSQIDRFPEAYKAFKEKGEMHVEGTPLRQWALLSPADIVGFEALKIFSVEAMAQIVATCKECGVPVGHPHVDTSNVERILKEGYRFLMAAPTRSYAALDRCRQLAGRA